MYCKKCGKEINDNAVICPSCGCATDKYEQKNFKNESDSSSAGWAVLGFLLPLIGLILYLVWKEELPLRAKSIGKGALVSVIVNVVIGLLWGILIGIGACAYIGSYAVLSAISL